MDIDGNAASLKGWIEAKIGRWSGCEAISKEVISAKQRNETHSVSQQRRDHSQDVVCAVL
jgi:hypothetical protein